MRNTRCICEECDHLIVRELRKNILELKECLEYSIKNARDHARQSNDFESKYLMTCDSLRSAEEEIKRLKSEKGYNK
jgi:archaellum component FlaC